MARTAEPSASEGALRDRRPPRTQRELRGALLDLERPRWKRKSARLLAKPGHFAPDPGCAPHARTPWVRSARAQLRPIASRIQAWPSLFRTRTQGVHLARAHPGAVSQGVQLLRP